MDSLSIDLVTKLIITDAKFASMHFLQANKPGKYFKVSLT